MGVTIEQYRAQIGAHNNIKLNSTCLPSNICCIQLVLIFMLFQLVFTIMNLQILYSLNTRYCFPTKNLTQLCKILSQLIVLFTKMSGYIVYVPLLLRIANDVEDNPGPTVYDVVDPIKTVCADCSQGDTRKFGQNAGKQCVAMCLTAVLHKQIKNVNEWDSSFLNVILCTGNSLYGWISHSINKRYLLLTDLPEMVST